MVLEMFVVLSQIRYIFKLHHSKQAELYFMWLNISPVHNYTVILKEFTSLFPA